MSYKTWEMVKMLTENPKLVFRNSIKGYKVSLGESGRILSHENSYNKAATIHIFYEDQGEAEWELVETPVTFLEAAKAFEESERIKCVYDNDSCIYDGKTNKCMVDLDGYHVTVKEILYGTWYIERGEV